MKFAECLAPGCGFWTVILAVVDVLPQHRAASFRLSQSLAHQRIRLAQRFLVRNLAHDHASYHAPRFFERLDLHDLSAAREN